MANLEEHITPTLQSASRWLNKAEQAFATKQDIRGELNLLLAEAEMQRLKELRQQQSKGLLIRHGISIGIAVGAAILCFLLFYRQPSPAVIQSAPITTEASVLPVAPNTNTQVPAVNKQADHPEDLVNNSEIASSPQSELSAPPTEGDVSAGLEVSKIEMHKLVRIAGKSLRGQLDNK